MKNILLLNASTRKNSTSKSMAEHMFKQAREKGHKAIVLDLIDFFEEKLPFEDLIQQMGAADSIGIIVPCYVNTLPYPTISCLEKIAQCTEGQFKGKPLFAIAHGGMPYEDVHEPCLTVCECFAEKLQMKWLGGIIRGFTPLINGKPLVEAGGAGRKIIKALNLVLEDVVEERFISPKAQKIVKIHMPPSLLNGPLVFLFNIVMKKDREAHGVIDFDRKPYL